MSLEALRAAVTRDRAERPAPTCDASLLGRYRGIKRGFTLEWCPTAHGYRRRFEPVGARVVWDEARVYSAAEVRAQVHAGQWRREKTL